MARTLPDVIAPNLDILIVGHFFETFWIFVCFYLCCHGNTLPVPPALRLGLTPDCCQPTKGTITPTLGTISVGLPPLPVSPPRCSYTHALLSCAGKCLFLSGFTEQQLNYSHDQSLPEIYGIGFTNMVERTTPGSKDLSKWVETLWNMHQETYLSFFTCPGFVLVPFFHSIFFCASKEIREGGRQLLAKLQKYRPLIAVFNGKGGVFLPIFIIFISV